MSIKDVYVVMGATIGAALGVLGFYWLTQQGFYGLVVPGGLTGIGAGFARGRNLASAIISGLIGLCAGLFSEWRFFPFIADDSLSYFLTHIHTLKPISLVMLALGTGLAFAIPFRNLQTPQQQSNGKSNVY